MMKSHYFTFLSFHISVKQQQNILLNFLKFLAHLNAQQNFSYTYHYIPKNWDRQAWVNSVEPDQLLQNLASDQGHSSCSFLGSSSGRKKFNPCPAEKMKMPRPLLISANQITWSVLLL